MKAIKASGALSSDDLTTLTTNDVNKLIAKGGIDLSSYKIKVSRNQVTGKSGGSVNPKTLEFDSITDGTNKYSLAGKSSNAHLHFELRIDTVSDNYKSMHYVNPIPWLPLNNVTVNSINPNTIGFADKLSDTDKEYSLANKMI